MAGTAGGRAATGSVTTEVLVVVHIVDDDEDLRRSLVFLLESMGITALTYPDGAVFLQEFDPDEPAVVVLDLRMPGMSGFQVQEELVRRDYPAPLVFCSAHGDVPMSVRAMQGGAVDFLEKPYVPQLMLDVIQHQLGNARATFAARGSRRHIETRLESLTPRETEVLRLVIDGRPSQAIASSLGTSIKTVDVHRAHIRAKTGAESLGELVRDILQNDVVI